MMPIQSYTSFQRMTSFCGTKVPDKIWADLHGVRDNDEAVKSYGIELCVKMCQEMAAFGIRGFHFYTLNLENSVLSTLAKLGVAGTSAAKKYNNGQKIIVTIIDLQNFALAWVTCELARRRRCPSNKLGKSAEVLHRSDE